MQRFSRSVMPNRKRVKDQTFVFDRVFDDNTTQGDVYESTTRNLLDSVMDGYNATVFAYGATGCGKTHTITGTAQQPGIIFLTMQELFERITDRNEEKVTEVSLSYLEIYNETIRDLLVPGGSKGGLMLREDANQGVSVAGLSSHHPQNVEEVMDMIMRGNEYRTMSPTDANATSSRSHAVLQINVSQKDRNADINEPHTMATLSVIDLAGSERASATKNRGERLLEGANINKSLLALGGCINALCDPRKRNHVPYRNSKLTRLLKFSLGGNCKTVMIVCVSPSSHHFDETQNTLRYANRAKNIQTKVTRNVYNVNRHVKDFLVKIDEQMALINELKQQQKDYESIAFGKFKKQNEKKEAVAREGVARIRTAYENSAPERLEKTNNTLRLRQISRRITMLSSWIAAFDNVCDNSENEVSLSNLQAIRKTAQGILIELEGSRQHYHQKLAKNNWERAISSALDNGLRQLQELETTDSLDLANLTREAEFLKSNAERETMSTITEQEKTGDVATVQVLLQAHFETVSAIENIMQLSEDEAIDAGRKILMKMLNSSSAATSHIVKPDASLPPVEAFPPTRSGTPKRKKRVSLLGAPTVKPMNAALAAAPHVSSSPIKGSPKRRKVPAPKKGVMFTPKKPQLKPSKKCVQWKDDTTDGNLAEFEKTPQKPQPQSTPDIPSDEPTLPTMPSQVLSPPPKPRDSPSSSPIPTPQPTLAVHKNNRFKTGFLAKKSSGSPVAPTLTSLSSSENEHSPLRDIENSGFGNRLSLEHEKRVSGIPMLGSNSSSPSSDTQGGWKANKGEAMKINSAMRRISGAHAGNQGSMANRNQRRRSPTAATSAGSPPSENAMFTASQARRMVKSDKEHSWKVSVLSPHTVPVMKANGQRRTTFGDTRPKEGGVASREEIRISAAAIPSNAPRGSLQPPLKGSWR